jgi:hypothetical protein
MTIFKVADVDIVYLSYDEPNAEKNYADLLTKIPWAKRVHGVEGSDAAHKACAELSETQRFITIDGDNLIKEDFLNQQISFKDGVDIKKNVISWVGYNSINGLMYGNGGIKCWDKDTVLNMKTHENADPDNPQAQVDFCWDLEYIQMEECMSIVENNYTPQQAWRAGFREGVKMSLIEGERPTLEEFYKVHWKNLHRLYIWTMVGADTPNGKWAIYGAREGLYKTMCTDWDYINVRDFEYLNTMWKDVEPKVSMAGLEDSIEEYGEKLVREMDLPISPIAFDEGQSKFFKSVYANPPRIRHHALADDVVTDEEEFGKQEYDIVMITYNEPYADKNFDALKKRFPRAQRINGVKGIHQAHIAAAKLAITDMVWIVDGDAVIVDDFNFDYTVSKWEKDFVHVWRSINPINDLEYGYGGVKLFPRQLTIDMDTTRPDMTTSISTKFRKVDITSNITAFNADPFTTWRSAFRECAKLSSKVIDRQKDGETDERLKIWTTTGNGEFSEYALRGANAGMEFGLSRRDDIRLINDFDWLKEQFDNEQ